MQDKNENLDKKSGMAIAMAVANRLILLREKLELNISEMAKKVKQNYKTYHRWENGIGEPGVNELIEIRENTGCSWLWLTLGKGEMYAKEGQAEAEVVIPVKKTEYDEMREAVGKVKVLRELLDTYNQRIEKALNDR